VSWAEVLADMERRIEAAEHALRSGGAPPAPFWLPTDLGPLPAGLVAQARRIQDDTARVTAQVSAARDLVAAALCRPHEIPSQAPAYIDARA
jgi:hypothetical protein